MSGKQKPTKCWPSCDKWYSHESLKVQTTKPLRLHHYSPWEIRLPLQLVPEYGIDKVIARHQGDHETEEPVQNVGDRTLRQNAVAQAAFLRISAVPLVVNDGVGQQPTQQETHGGNCPEQYIHIGRNADSGQVDQARP